MNVVYLRSGEQPRAFPFGNTAAFLPYATANGNSLPIYKEAIYSAFQAVVTGAGAVTATIAIQGSNSNEAGNGIIHGGDTAPGMRVILINGSPTIQSIDKAFTADMVGTLVDAVGVPPGTTLTAVASGSLATMSANATVVAPATGIGVQAVFRTLEWVATVLGTITLTGSGLVSDGFQSQASWRFVRAIVTNVTGTNARVRILMGV